MELPGPRTIGDRSVLGTLDLGDKGIEGRERSISPSTLLGGRNGSFQLRETAVGPRGNGGP